MLLVKNVRPCGPMDKAPDYESGDCRFEWLISTFLGQTLRRFYIPPTVVYKSFLYQLSLGSQTARSPVPTLPWGQWASLRYTSLAGGGRVSCGFHICDLNSSACLAYISSFYTFRVFFHSLLLHLSSTATFSRPFS